MKALALIVDGGTPDLTRLAVASLQRFAPGVQIDVVPAVTSDQPHADTIEAQRPELLRRAPDVVILFDSDACVCSPGWWPAIAESIEEGASVVGAFRSRGDASQMFIDGVPVMHASMLAMTASAFEKTSSFRSEYDPVTQFVQLDTGARVSLEAYSRGETIATRFAFFRVGHGPLFPGLQVGEYFDLRHRPVTAWAHAWRGTMAPVGWRTRLGAVLGSPHARTRMRAAERIRRYYARGREIVAGYPFTAWGARPL